MHKFPYDRRPSRQRFKERFEKFQPFPYDRHDGKGFNRNDVVDFDRVKRHYDHATNGHQEEVEIRELQPATTTNRVFTPILAFPHRGGRDIG